MGKVISVVTLGKLIAAHYEGDSQKFDRYAQFILEAYKEEGNLRSAAIIERSITGEYKDEPKVVLD